MLIVSSEILSESDCFAPIIQTLSCKKKLPSGRWATFFIQVPKVVWRDYLGWNFLKDPFAICTAVVAAVLIAILSNSFDPSNTFNLVWILTTVLLVMIVGSAERILVESIFRMIGTLLGVGLGALIAFGHGQMLNHGASSVSLYAYQLSLQVIIIFTVAVLSKAFRVVAEIIYFTGLTATIMVFAPDLAIAYQRILSILLAIGASLLCTVSFHYTMAQELLFKEHKTVAANVLQLTEFAIISELSEKHDFDQSASIIRASLISSSVVWGAYRKWRFLTLRKPIYDFAAVTQALRPLYYEVFSLYWSHIETTLRPGDARILYCDTEGDYEVLFKPLVHSIIEGVREVKACLAEIIEPYGITNAFRRSVFHRLTNIIVSSFFLNLELLNMRYIDNRLLCYSSRSQRWNMCDYMISLTCVLMELTEYLKQLVLLFAKEDIAHYEDIVIRLSHLKDQLNTLKYGSRIMIDVTPALAPHAVHLPEGEVVSNPDFSRSERRS